MGLAKLNVMFYKTLILTLKGLGGVFHQAQGFLPITLEVINKGTQSKLGNFS